MRRPGEDEIPTSIVDITLIQVNGVDVPLNEVVRQLGAADNLGIFVEFARRELVRQLAVHEGVCTTLEDVHGEVDRWRYKHRLERVEDTEAWLVVRGITLQDVAADAEFRLLERMLSDKVVLGKIEPFFAQHTLDFDEAEVCWIFQRNGGVIEEIALQAREDGADFARWPVNSHKMTVRARPADLWGASGARSCRRELPRDSSPPSRVISSDPKRRPAVSRYICCSKTIRPRWTIASQARFATHCSISGCKQSCNGRTFAIR